ncbi:MAG: PadR family transcriptional regulator [Sphaerochaetaceae bacterium]|jgi:PadR family transcriptional regulator, regulatory protein PadR|nr:PadR family transcriptional regulator [Sphaerochaetaceae bacterium]
MIFPIGSTMLDALILSQLNQGDVYGYALTQQLKDVLETSESSLYPVLRRLQKSDCLETYDVPYQGRLRRFYHITNQGKKMLEFYRAQWKEYKTCIGSFLEKK